MSTGDKKLKKGRPGFDSVHVGLKMPKILEKRFIEKSAELRALGYKTNKSDLIRRLAEYWLDDAEDLFAEWQEKERAG